MPGLAADDLGKNWQPVAARRGTGSLFFEQGNRKNLAVTHYLGTPPGKLAP
jgi:hypothetical protein